MKRTIWGGALLTISLGLAGGLLPMPEALAKRVWPHGDPIGRRIRFGVDIPNNGEPWLTVVGVVADVHDNGVQEAPPTMVYWPVMMDNFWADTPYITRNGGFVIRSERAASEAFLSEIRQAVWSSNENLPLFRVRTLDDVYRQSMARTSFTLVMLAIAAAMALMLGLVGIYGVISYSVTQRTREIGIRRALGAGDARLKGMFVRHALILSAVGVLIGLSGAAGLTKYMEALLYGVTPLDPLTYVAVPLLLSLAAATAAYLPSRRATKVDPIDALRTE